MRSSLGAEPAEPSKHASEAVQQDEYLVGLGLGDEPDRVRSLDGRGRFIAFGACDTAALLSVGTVARGAFDGLGVCTRQRAPELIGQRPVATRELLGDTMAAREGFLCDVKRIQTAVRESERVHGERLPRPLFSRASAPNAQSA